MILIFSSCARQLHYSDEESGRVAAFFHVGESHVRKIYAESAFSWDGTIKKLVLEMTSNQSENVPEEFTGRIDDEVEKIKQACRLVP